MGITADRFRAEIEEMKARHAETDRRIQTTIDRMDKTIARIKRINREIDDI